MKLALSDKFNIAGLSNKTGKLVNTVNLHPDIAGHLAVPQEVVSLVRSPVAVEAESDPGDLLCPGRGGARG